MRHSSRNDDHVSGADFATLAALQRAAAHARTDQHFDGGIVGLDPLGVDHLAAGYHGPGTLDDGVDLGHLVMLDGGVVGLDGSIDAPDSYIDFPHVDSTNLF